MKNTIKLSILLLLISLVLFSCKKDEEEVVDPPLSVGVIQVDINGVQLKTVTGTAAILEFGTVAQSLQINLTLASLSTTKTLVIDFSLPITEEIHAQTYTENGVVDCVINSSDFDICSFIGYTELDLLSGGSLVEYSSEPAAGNTTIVISAINYSHGGQVSGTFSGKLVGDDGSILTLTNGKFNVNIV